MKLTDMVPKESKFYLRLVDRSFTMRPMNLNDEIWLSNEYGAKIQEVFEQINIKEISRIVFRLIQDEDKKFFKKREVEIIDENGDTKTSILGGVELLQTLVSGWEDKEALLKALLENIGASRPEIEKKDEAKEEKKTPEN